MSEVKKWIVLLADGQSTCIECEEFDVMENGALIFFNTQQNPRDGRHEQIFVRSYAPGFWGGVEEIEEPVKEGSD